MTDAIGANESASYEARWPERPYCECGGPGCFDAQTLLPADAWQVAGAEGAGAHESGADLCAIHPEHLQYGMLVVAEHDGWLTVVLEDREVGLDAD